MFSGRLITHLTFLVALFTFSVTSGYRLAHLSRQELPDPSEGQYHVFTGLGRNLGGFPALRATTPCPLARGAFRLFSRSRIRLQNFDWVE